MSTASRAQIAGAFLTPKLYSVVVVKSTKLWFLSLLPKTGDVASLRRLFALLKVGDCNGDFSTTMPVWPTLSPAPIFTSVDCREWVHKPGQFAAET